MPESDTNASVPVELEAWLLHEGSALYQCEARSIALGHSDCISVLQCDVFKEALGPLLKGTVGTSAGDADCLVAAACTLIVLGALLLA